MKVAHRIVLLIGVACLALALGTVARAQVDVNDAFELEGDLDDIPPGGLNDWVNMNCPAIGGSNAAVKSGAIFDGIGPSIFTQGGSKDIRDVSEWRHRDGSVPDKDEILNAYAGEYISNGDTLLYVGGDRFDNEGSAFIGAWFFQNEVEAVTTGPDAGKFIDPATGLPAKHSDGDILILATFTGGGKASEIQVFEWVGTTPGACSGTLQKGGTLCDITLTGGFGVTQDGFANPVPLAIPGACPEWQVDTKDAGPGVVPENSFFEVGINLSSLNLGNVCFASFLLETRSSHDVDAQLKDFVLHSFAPCELDCGKAVNDTEVCEGESVTYTYTATNPGGVSLLVTLTDDNFTAGNTSDDYCVVPPGASGTCTTFSIGNPACEFTLGAGETRSCTLAAALDPGGHTNTLSGSGSPVGGTLELTCGNAVTVTVNPNPVVSIDHLVACEYAATFDLCASVASGTAPFRFAWNTGDTTPCVTKSATGSYSVTVTDAKNCVDSAARTVGFCSD